MVVATYNSALCAFCINRFIVVVNFKFVFMIDVLLVPCVLLVNTNLYIQCKLYHYIYI